VTVYTYAELEQLWIQAGGPRGLAPLAAAIGEAESGGNSDALNPNDNNGTQSSFGIWQISNGTHTPPSPNWSNPAVNAQLAVGKWRGAGQSFSPWGTYDSGAYKAFLSGKIPPASTVPGSPTQNATTMAFQASLDCLVGNPFQASAFGFNVSAGPACLFTKSNARAFIGAGLMGWGFIIAFSGGMWVMAGAALHAAGGLPTGINVLIPIPKTGSGWNPSYPAGANPAAGNNVPGPTSPGPGPAGPPTYASSGPARLGQGAKVIPGEVIGSTTAAAGELGAAPLALAAA
jgi:hypothetical protein